ncbi:MAG TPA: hypothetical protein VMV31_07330 [Terriglobales bacterium]|nr:hypothetical protein [Terriglobales bacterium]
MRSSVIVAAACALIGLAAAQVPAPPALPSGTHLQAQLKTKLDTQRAQVGDPVTAVTTQAVKAKRLILLPKGTVLTGHVTSVVAAESKKSPSHMSVLFDHAVTKQGMAFPLHAAIAQVVVMPSLPPDMDAGMGGDMGMDMPTPQPAAVPDDNHSNRTGTLGDQPLPPVVTASAPSAATRGSNGHPIYITLPHGTQADPDGSLLSTPQGDLKLDRGTRVVLLVLPQ